MEPYYTPDEIAERLKITRRTIYQWLKQGRLKGVKLGDLWRVSESDLKAFLAGDQEKEAAA